MMIGPDTDAVQDLSVTVADQGTEKGRIDVVFWGADVMLQNAENSRHWSEKETAVWRNIGFMEATRLRLAKNIGPVEVYSRLWYPESHRGKLCDTTAWYPTTKAIIDGLTDYGMWPDDDGHFVQFEGFHRAQRVPTISEKRVRVQLVKL